MVGIPGRGPRRLAPTITLGAALVLGGCASGSGSAHRPVVSPTGIVYEAGTPPSETRQSQTATLYLRSEEPHRGLELALEGIEAHPDNPIHYFLAGVAYTRLGAYEEADGMFREAERIYPAYELDIEPERAAAWAEAFNLGAEAYADGDLAEVVERWGGATMIFDLRPEAHQNLGILLAGEGRYDEAIDVYARALAGLEKKPATRVLDDEELEAREVVRLEIEGELSQLLLSADRFAEAEPLLRRQLEREPGDLRLRQSLAHVLSAQGRTREAGEIHESLLSQPNLPAPDLFNLGVAFFRAGDYPRAATAFERLTRLRPHSRDVWFNYVNALFAAEDWETLVSAAERLLELDPLSESVGLIAARALLETGDERAALEGLDRLESAPVHVEGLVMRRRPQETSVQGLVAGNRLEAGMPVRLRFIFYGDGDREEVGTEVVTLSAPPPGQSEPFELSFRMAATAYRYEVLEQHP